MSFHTSLFSLTILHHTGLLSADHNLWLSSWCCSLELKLSYSLPITLCHLGFLVQLKYHLPTEAFHGHANPSLSQICSCLFLHSSYLYQFILDHFPLLQQNTWSWIILERHEINIDHSSRDSRAWHLHHLISGKDLMPECITVARAHTNKGKITWWDRRLKSYCSVMKITLILSQVIAPMM
jgi:hypothetical protein